MFLFLLGFTSSVVVATYDVIYHSACCDKCDCSVKEGQLFPQCICRDAGCHSACKKCDCIRESELEIPNCYCADVMLFTCYDLCKQ